FSAANVREDAPQQVTKTWRAFPGDFAVSQAGEYEVIVSDGAREEIPMRQITLTLRAQSETVKTDVVYAGIAAMAIGAIGLVISLRRRRGGPGGGASTASKTASEKSPMRWGRG
ncbi:MAG TPA: hypothetical protein PKE65_07415, partial [Rhizobiaceae bacterium]|nr:hypothetical protein [Rhizobiaceae bacterium]